MQFALNMDREKLNKISKYCKKMQHLEENKQFSEDYKRAVLEKLKKRDKLWTNWLQRKLRKTKLGVLFRNVLQKRK